MIKSMTGFGRAEIRSPEGPIRVEIKTTNHKFFEVSSRLPGHLMEFEDEIRKMICQEVRRGKISVFVASPDPSVSSSRLRLNEPLAREVFHKITRLRSVLKLSHRPDDAIVLREVLHYPDVLTKDTSFNRQAFFTRQVQGAVRRAITSLLRSKLLEGRALFKDFTKRLREIETSLRVIEKRQPALGREYRASLERKMKEFVKNGELDRERLTVDVAAFLKNVDVSEEVTRLKSHIAAMRKALRENGELGRKLDFIAQEMTRETNTIGAKSNDVNIANAVIAIKSAIEKIREQAQNVE